MVKKKRGKRPKRPQRIPYEEYQGWIVGWPDIGKYCGGVSINTLRSWVALGLPVMRTPSDKPMVIPRLLDIWIIDYNKFMYGTGERSCWFCGQSMPEKGDEDAKQKK
jgi:hypothetical protein